MSDLMHFHLHPLRIQNGITASSQIFHPLVNIILIALLRIERQHRIPSRHPYRIRLGHLRSIPPALLRQRNLPRPTPLLYMNPYRHRIPLTPFPSSGKGNFCRLISIIFNRRQTIRNNTTYCILHPRKTISSIFTQYQGINISACHLHLFFFL